MFIGEAKRAEGGICASFCFLGLFIYYEFKNFYSKNKLKIFSST